MNTLATAIMTDPYGKISECIQFTIDDTSNPFVLSDIMTVGLQYTFSLWLMSDANASLSTAGDTFAANDLWNMYSVTFTASGTDLLLNFGNAGVYYIYHPQLENGNKATDWTPSPEDMATAEDIAEVNAAIETNAIAIADLSVTSENISASVTRIEESVATSTEALSDDIATLTEQVSAKMSAEDVAITIRTELENGTTKVITETGYTFDDDGLTVAKSGSEMKTQITENGMTVYQNEEAVLTANNVGVDAKNLHATTYLIVGGNSRFEDYGEGRTGCFWIGG